MVGSVLLRLGVRCSDGRGVTEKAYAAAGCVPVKVVERAAVATRQKRLLDRLTVAADLVTAGLNALRRFIIVQKK